MIKIAYFIDSIHSPNAGTEQQLLMLLNNLDRDQFEPHLLCLRDSAWLQSQKFTFPVHILNFTKLMSFSLKDFIGRFKKLHDEIRFDIVQTFFTDANIAGVIAARVAGVKVIIAGRRNAGDRLSRLQLTALRFIGRYTTKYLANSEGIAKTTAEIEKIKPGKFAVIYNGMYLDRFDKLTASVRAKQRQEWNIAEDETLIGLIANLRPVKNIESLIKAASELTKTLHNLKFAVAGDGPHRDKLQTLINSAGLDQRFRLVGRHSDVIPCLAAFDIGVLCSKAEGFSNSLIEYMAAGLPVVASDVGGNGEAVSHGETGLIYDPADPNGLTESLRQLIENQAQAKAMGELAKTTAVAKYSVKAYIDNHQSFYKQLVEEAKAK